MTEGLDMSNLHAIVRRGFAAVLAMLLMAALAWISPARAVTTGTVTVSDDAPDISPAMTFTYTLTKPRTLPGDNLIRISSVGGRPANFPAYNAMNCASLLAVTTIKVNGVTMDNSTYIESNPSVCGSFSPGSILLVLSSTAPDLAVGDVVQITFGSGLFVNPSSEQTGTWKWNTSNAAGGDRDEFEASLTSGGNTFATSTVATTSPPTTSTPTTSAPSSSVPSDDGSGGGEESTSGPGDLSGTGLSSASLLWLGTASIGLGLVLLRRARPVRVQRA